MVGYILFTHIQAYIPLGTGLTMFHKYCGKITVFQASLHENLQ